MGSEVLSRSEWRVKLLRASEYLNLAACGSLNRLNLPAHKLVFVLTGRVTSAASRNGCASYFRSTKSSLSDS